MTERSEPRPHAELAAQFMADSTLKCWVWSPRLQMWTPDIYPMWHDSAKYHVGHEPPTEPPQKTCRLAGVDFPMPLEGAAILQEKWLVRIDAGMEGSATYFQATKAGAQAQIAAMTAAVHQAIQRAK